MQCYVYKGKRKADCYLYLPSDDGMDQVPEALLDQLGELEHVLTFDLHPGRKLAQEDANNVIASLKDRGFHLQMPPPEEPPH